MSNLNVLMNNTSALFTDRQIGITDKNKVKSLEKLSSGYKINRAADDAAGLTISEKMRFYIRGLNQGVDNIQDGVSFCQVADGALNEVHDMLQRMNELAVKSANDTNSEEDRQAIDSEVAAIKSEITRIFDTTEFNEREIFSMPYSPDVSRDPNEPETFQLYNSNVDNNGEVKFGGIEVYNVRYTWNDLGIASYIGDDGIIHVPANEDDNKYDDIISKDFTYTLKNAGGETVRLRLVDGASVRDISRVYEWSADNEGIKINNVKAKSWSDLGVTNAGASENIISFEHKGITYSFDTKGDDKKKIISGINGDGLLREGIFTASAGARTTEKAVDIVSSPVSVNITSGNKSRLDDDYSISADAGGVTLKRIKDPDGDSSGASIKKINWGDFTDKNGSSFKISDFGLNDNTFPKTFDSSAEYSYKDPDSGIEFSFKLTDEASRDGIINGFNNARIGESYSAGGSVAFTTSSDSHGGSVSLNRQYIAGNTVDNVRAQKAIGRNFDNTSATDITVTKKVEKSGEERAGSEALGTPSTISDNWNPETSKYIYIKKDDNTYTRYIEKTQTRKLIQQQSAEKGYEQDYKISYQASAGLRTSPSSGNMTASYKDTYMVTNTSDYTYYAYSDETDVAAADVPVDAEIITQKRTNIENKTRSESGHTRTIVSGGSKSDSVSVTSSKGVKIADLTFNTSANIQGLGFTATNTLRFTPSGSASVTFSANENSMSDGNITLSQEFARYEAITPVKQLFIQAGDDADNTIEIRWSGLNLTALGISNTNVLTAERARSAIDEVRTAINKVSTVRSNFGAYQNRLEHAINQNKNTSENLQAAESRIRDTDMAKESVKLAKEEILSQASMSMLAQANQQKQGILNLLQ